ncbi:MAG TPA: TIGR03118 family protein [Kofleriaceae bacterium]|nr:TIGR03118 family protein [Kofleriaceae bacterium]
MVALTACDDDDDDIIVETGFFEVTNLVSDQPGVAQVTDPNLVNPWGLAFGPNTFFWTANNGTSTATVFQANGTPAPAGSPLVVDMPAAVEMSPTGTVFNPTTGFNITANNVTAPAQFIFVSEDGSISGWNPDVSPTAAVLARTVNGAVFKGVEIAQPAGADPLLFAANFSAGRIDVFDTGFQPVNLGPTAFVDSDLPAGFAPFNIKLIGTELFVTFALQNADRTDDVPGAGNGFVDVFGLDGTFLRRFASRGELNAPWGLAAAPNNFGEASDAILVGNFGDGLIHAFNVDGTARGPLLDANGVALQIDGLWALQFGNGAMAGPQNVLFFTAGPDDETHGLFGQIVARAAVR